MRGDKYYNWGGNIKTKSSILEMGQKVEQPFYRLVVEGRIPVDQGEDEYNLRSHVYHEYNFPFAMKERLESFENVS